MAAMADTAAEAVPHEEPSFSDGEANAHELGRQSPSEDSAAGTDPEEVAAAIRKQVEFYFSDANLPTDKYLLKQIAKDPDGFVPIKVIAGFKRIKALTKNVAVITSALAASPQLVLSEDAKCVKRAAPMPEIDMQDVQRRMVLAEHLPGTPTIESVTQLFAAHGNVRMVRICTRGTANKLPAWLSSIVDANFHAKAEQYALVEFSSPEEAAAAVAAFKNPDNWRTSLHVRPLLLPPRGDKQASSSKVAARTDDSNRPRSRRGSETGESSRSHTPTQLQPQQLQQKEAPLPALPAIRTSAAASAATAAMSGSVNASPRASPYIPPHGSPTKARASALGNSAVATGSPRASNAGGSPSRTTSNAAVGASASAPPTPLVSTPPAELAALIDRILLGPTNPRAPGSGPASPKALSSSDRWGSGAGGSGQSSPKAAAISSGAVRAPTRLGTTGAAAAVAAPAAAAAAAAAQQSSGSASAKGAGGLDGGARPGGGSSNGGSSGAAADIHGASAPGPWGRLNGPPSAAQVDAHFGPTRRTMGRDSDGVESDDQGSSASKPPRAPAGTGRQRRQSWHPTSADDVSALAPAKTANAKSVQAKSSLSERIEAIREASCEVDPAVAAAAIATLSGTASKAAPGATASSTTKQRRLSYSEGGVPDVNGAEAGAGKKKGSGSRSNRASEDGGGEGGEGEGKKRRNRQRRKSTGSRRASLDMSDPTQASNSSQDEDNKPKGRRSSNGAAAAAAIPKPGKKDYAAWAAATPEFRAEAASMKHPGARGGTATPPSGTPPRMSFMNHAQALAGRTSPIRFMSVGAEAGAIAQSVVHGEGVRQPRMPDGTRGFGMGRGKPVVAPAGAAAH